MEIEVVRQGADWVVIDKPSGMLSVPGKGPEKADCARVRVMQLFPDATGPITVHRLDMDTSGLLIHGLTPEAQRALSMQFEARTVEKTYIAVTGPLDAGLGDMGVVDFPIGVDWPNRPKQTHDPEKGRPSTTKWRIIGRTPTTTRLEFTPITGRSHQLRVHAAHEDGLHCPILGDRLYGDADAAPRLLLHAATLTFDDPTTGERVTVASEPGF